MVRLEKAVWCFCRSVTRHLLSADEDEADYAADCRNKLRPELAEALIAARHRPTRALYELSTAIAELPIDERRQISMDASVSILCDSMGSSERIFTSPVPRFFTRHTARFLEIWLFLAPLGLYDAFGNTWNHWGTYVSFCGVHRQQMCMIFSIGLLHCFLLTTGSPYRPCFVSACSASMNWDCNWKSPSVCCRNTPLPRIASVKY
jgi:predicted membrane chloride channel (bestrophin family)